MRLAKENHRIVVVGGGAGGLELAAQLGRQLGNKGIASITLVDASFTHLWKPLLHEVAAGTLDSNEDELNYFAYAYHHGFEFQPGCMYALNREQKYISLKAIKDDEGQEIIPARDLSYDTLVMAVGSVSHDFGTLGVAEHCILLDSRTQAEKFHQYFLQHLMQLHFQTHPAMPLKDFNVVIIGGGATGVELAAELHYVLEQTAKYGKNLTPSPPQVKLIIIEAANRILAQLPERLSVATLKELQRRGIEVLANQKVAKVTTDAIITQSGLHIPTQLKVWAAGIKAPTFLTGLDGLETNGLNQLVVKPTLQTTRDEAIFALGDCAYCPRPDSKLAVPPRAQAAHQQATLLVKSLKNRLQGKSLLVFRYQDYGSLISLSQTTAVGNLMGSLTGPNIMLEGKLARWVYWSLYKMHQTALFGLWRVILLTIAQWLTKPIKPKLKLH